MAGEAGAGTTERVLFACTWNASRSPMAAALSTRFARGLAAADSAGVHGGRPVDPLAVAAMAEWGLDIAGHRPHSLDDIEREGGDLGAYDVIVALSEAAARETAALGRLTGVPVERWAIEDPTLHEGPDAARLDAYRRARDAIAASLRRRFDAA